MGDYVWPKRGRGQSDSRVVQFKRYYHDGALQLLWKLGERVRGCAGVLVDLLLSSLG